jgi:hypothetical protein
MILVDEPLPEVDLSQLLALQRLTNNLTVW